MHRSPRQQKNGAHRSRVSPSRQYPAAQQTAAELRETVSAVTRAKDSHLISRGQIRAYCEAIVRKFHPLKIIHFGSYAYGDPTPDSEVDLMVITAFRGNDVNKAIQIRSGFDTPFPFGFAGPQARIHSRTPA